MKGWLIFVIIIFWSLATVAFSFVILVSIDFILTGSPSSLIAIPFFVVVSGYAFLTPWAFKKKAKELGLETNDKSGK